MNNACRIILIFLLLCTAWTAAEELPRPGYGNSMAISFAYPLRAWGDLQELDYIKSRFGNGLYCPLALTTFIQTDMDWHVDISRASNNISKFKNTVDNLVTRARANGLGLHFILTFGISRHPGSYDEAKAEDVRNTQWYNDNNFLSEGQWQTSLGEPAGTSSGTARADDPGAWVNLNQADEFYRRRGPAAEGARVQAAHKYALSTMSRYARKLRGHLEAKIGAVMAYLAAVQHQNQDMLIIISAPGEAELNLHPVNNNAPLLEFVCDYSPFAVLEFRDWIRHRGLYADSARYGGEGFSGGGVRYRGTGGLGNFNADYGTNFSSWNLKYFHWGLGDAVDGNYTDNGNPDPGVIPLAAYSFGGMMPTSGPGCIAGGFDPPRQMKQKGNDAFWDLWQKFRESLVGNYVKDTASIARARGMDRDRYYSHQIPADYLFGTRPGDPGIPYLNSRFYSSASPLDSAYTYSDMGAGMTLYDVSFGSWYARTSLYAVDAMAALNPNWAAVEYNPEVLASGLGVSMNTPGAIYGRMMRLYDAGAHFISFFNWTDNADHEFRGNNREEAAKLFFDAVKDKARGPLSKVFTPKKVEQLTAYIPASGLGVVISWSDHIWTGPSLRWEHWGDFKDFVVFRGSTQNFTANSASRIGRTSSAGFTDTAAPGGGTVFYKVAAVNRDGKMGPVTVVSANPGGTGGTPVLQLSDTAVRFGATTGGITTPARRIRVQNSGQGVLNWSVKDDAGWLAVSPDSGSGAGTVTLSADVSGLAAGTYSGSVTVSAPGADDSPQTVAVDLRVYTSGGDSAPFGSYDLPDTGKTHYGSVAFTGWVLDDIGVDTVKIYRREGAVRRFVGDAVMVEGARTDIQVDYASFPNNHKAGWGYMMLTNFLPGGGNGTYVIEAVATDATGHETSLGSKAVICDNQHAVEPFGAVDTPDQGGTASGGSFRNWGWVLTPMPNRVPLDGSTIEVFVDGQLLGNVHYGFYRSDIAGLFPGYYNSDTAFGYFDIDTTAFDDGIYTLHWIVYDSAGNGAGIGSRYFSIVNGSASRKNSVRTMAAPVLPMGPSKLKSIPTAGDEALYIKTGGHRKGTCRWLKPGKKGEYRLHLPPLGRVEIALGGPGGAYAGWQSVGETLGPLPVGARLDHGSGVFYFHPGLGFRGQYRFVFFLSENGGPVTRRVVTVQVD